MQPVDLDQIPFSIAGSFLTITARNSRNSPRLLYRTVSARLAADQSIPYDPSEFFEIALFQEENEVPYTWSVEPPRLTLIAESGAWLSFLFCDLDTLLFQAKGVTLRLFPCKVFPVEFSPQSQQIVLMDWAARGFHYFRSVGGGQVRSSITTSVSGLDHYTKAYPRTIEFTGPAGAIRFVEHEQIWDEPFPDFDSVFSARKKGLKKWMQSIPDVPASFQEIAEQAWFILWNCQVPPGGALTRPAIYMSKSWMNAAWAWDNCFNALAVVKADPALAWDQIRLFVDHQESHGMLPDMINNLEPIYGFNKPPVYGWAIQKMIREQGLKRALPYISEIYKPLVRLTEWWYTFRDFDGDGMPQYHHGNDSGWDNATVFDQGMPTEGADLAAYLVLQCEAIAQIAYGLNHRKASARWYEQSINQLDRLLNLQVRNKHFFSPLNGQSSATESHSLLNYIPILLGSRLPAKILKKLVRDLGPEGPFLTAYGLASEAITSPFYLSDGYWRGPIWAASNYLIFDGLLNAGENVLADTIAERFCNLCKCFPGLWENYDALTGQGLRCPGYSWTASVFLLLANYIARRQSKENR